MGINYLHIFNAKYQTKKIEYDRTLNGLAVVYEVFKFIIIENGTGRAILFYPHFLN